MSILNNPILGTIISIVLIYALLSILVSVLVEWINHYQKSRGKMLRSAIEKMLDDPANLEYSSLFFNHRMITGISGNSRKRPPQYISSHMFAEILIDLISQQDLPKVKSTPNTSNSNEVSLNSEQPEMELMKLFLLQLHQMNDGSFKDMMLSFYQKSNGEYEKLKALLEKWYNDQMDRVSGWYKSRQKSKFLWVGFVVALGLNVDSIFLFNVLSKNEALRNELVRVAEDSAEDYSKLTEVQRHNTSEQIKTLQNSFKAKRDTNRKAIVLVDTSRIDTYLLRTEKLIGALDSTERKNYSQTKDALGLISNYSLPIGWRSDLAPLSWFNKEVKESKVESGGLISYLDDRNNKASKEYVFYYLIGLVVSGFSLSFGAPFWFDLLMKIVNIRRAGNKPSNSKTT